MDFIDAIPTAGLYVCSDECMIIRRSFGLELTGNFHMGFYTAQPSLTEIVGSR